MTVRSIRLLTGASLFVLAGSAVAQTAQSPAAAEREDSGALAEIVVTAERVESNLQRTPISVAVVNGAQLVQRGVNTISQIQNLEPTIVFNHERNQGGNTIAIRGVSSVGGTFGGSAVTVNNDGQYLLTGFNAALYDIQRVEVLKGPQGTLYGMNATAGAISLISNAPELGRFGGQASVELGNYDAIYAQGAINLPIGDDAAVRVAGVRTRRNGYRQHPGTRASDYSNITAGRLSLLWKPAPALKIRLTGEYTDLDLGSAIVQGQVVAPSAATPAGSPPTGYVRTGLDPRSWPVNFDGYAYGHQTAVRGQVDYDFGWAQLTYLGAFRHTKLNLWHPNFGTPVQIVDYRQKQFTESHQQELRLAGNTSFGTRWQLGAFYLRYTPEDVTDIYNTVTRFNPTRTLPFLHFDNYDRYSVNRAIYGQITQSITDQLSVTGGLRYTDVIQKANGSYVFQLDVGAYNASSGATVNYNRQDARGRNPYKRTSWRVGVDFQATPRSLIYASASTSFKDGGFTQVNTFKPEDILAFELGTKNRFFDNRLQFNAAIYRYNYRNQQATAFIEITPATPTTPAFSVGTTVNAGRSRLTGAEANLLWQVTPNDQLSLAANYTDAKYTRFIAAQPVVPAGSVTAVAANLAGKTPPNAPKWLLNGGYTHTFNLSSGEIELRADARYTTSYFLSFYNLPADRQKGFMQTDLTATYRSANNVWEAGLFVRNLEDNNTLSYAQFLVQGQGIFVFAWNPPRTYGVRASVKF